MLANTYINMYASATVTKKMYKLMNGLIPFNRIFGYYLDNYITTYHAGKDIRIYNENDLIESESMALFDDCHKSLNKLSKNQMKYSSYITGSAITISALVYLFVALRAQAGLFGVGSVVRYIGSINEFITGFTGFMNQLVTPRTNNECMKALFDFLDISSQVNIGTLPVNRKVRDAQENDDYIIEFCNVSFKYPGSSTYVLRNVSVKFNVGERLAVVGMNGSGKTTMIKLLCRLYDPTEGKILLNGIDIREYDYKEYLSIFSVVFQDFKMYSFGLGQNVAANVDYDKFKVEECLKKAGFGERYI